MKKTIAALALTLTMVLSITSTTDVNAKAKAVNRTVKCGQTVSLKKVKSIKGSKALYDSSVVGKKVKLHFCKEGKLTVKAGKKVYKYTIKSRVENYSGSQEVSLGSTKTISLKHSHTELLKGKKATVKVATGCVAANVSLNGDHYVVNVKGNKVGNDTVTFVSACGVKHVVKVTVVEPKTITTTKVVEKIVEVGTPAKAEPTPAPTTEQVTQDVTTPEPTETPATEQKQEEVAPEPTPAQETKPTTTPAPVAEQKQEEVVTPEPTVTVEDHADDPAPEVTTKEPAKAAPTITCRDLQVISAGDEVVVRIPDGYFFAAVDGRSNVISVVDNGDGTLTLKAIGAGSVDVIYMAATGDRVYDMVEVD